MNVNDTVKSTLEYKTHICAIQNGPCMNPCLNDNLFGLFSTNHSPKSIIH